jgi:hypothetical protein
MAGDFYILGLLSESDFEFDLRKCVRLSSPCVESAFASWIFHKMLAFIFSKYPCQTLKKKEALRLQGLFQHEQRGWEKFFTVKQRGMFACDQLHIYIITSPYPVCKYLLNSSHICQI